MYSKTTYSVKMQKYDLSGLYAQKIVSSLTLFCEDYDGIEISYINPLYGFSSS